MKPIEGPKGRIYPYHSPKRVALVGMGPSFQDYLTETLTQELTPEHHDEVWGINMIGNTFRCDLIFWMDDLKTQAELKPHINVPTAALKQSLSGPAGAIMASVGGETMQKYISQIMGLGEFVRQATYDEFVSGFDKRLPYMANVPINAVMEVKNAMVADKNNNVRDESATLAGLIQMLDRHGTPVITAHRRPDYVRNSFDYPIDEVCNIGIPVFGKPYLNNGVAQAIAYAIWKGVEHLKIYGCDFTYPNREYAEEGRACVESWITLAITKNIQIGLPTHTSIMDMVKPPLIYGYAEPPEIEFQGQILKFGDGTAPLVNPADFKFKAPDTRNEVSNVISQSNQADSATGPARSKRRLRAPARPSGAVRPDDGGIAQA